MGHRRARRAELHALDRDVEQIEAPVDEIDAVVNGGGEAQNLAEALARRRLAPERQAQIRE